MIDDLSSAVVGALNDVSGGAYPIGPETKVSNLPAPLNVIADFVSRACGVRIDEVDITADLTVAQLVEKVQLQRTMGER